MKKKADTFTLRAARLMADKRFFWAVVALLILEAGWIALSSRYPMAFDEDFHLGIINLYAHHISPFWNGQPAGGDAFGAVFRDPSYLYHWLMSFPYRLISAFTDNQAVQVLLLRFINIGLFAWGLVLFRRLLLQTKAASAVVHAALLVLVLLPVVPLMAAQVNYDNLLFPVVAFSSLLALRVAQGLKVQQKIDLPALTGLIMLWFAGSLIKFPFLPIALAQALYVTYWLWRTFSWRELWEAYGHSLRAVGTKLSMLLLAGLLITAFLFAERYGVNVVRYHNLTPACDSLLSVESCSQYSVWRRNNLAYKQNPIEGVNKAPWAYDVEWFYGMWFRTFFAVSGPPAFQTRGPLVLPGVGAIALAAFGLVALAVTARQLWRRYDKLAMSLFAAITLIYVTAVWAENYQAYLELDRPVAINGRYLVLVYPFIILAFGLAVARLLARWPRLRLGVAAAALVCLMWGGGALTYVLRSNDSWYWHSQPVYIINHAIQTALDPIVPGTSKPTQFLR